ncbi:hypothetical protein GGP41_007738 [Bipolaris sorokiniana]|uniref:Uncharacterized protein n=2 Tax=Cochliobolus sativus TaxID=45130 RepID=A0A8H5ZNE6_COCSA|nr:uncharacterized protein COCSADRAFT_204361 [Bipolaris sorokiniana ND90Pr]EMD58376.1 hypothetical protein COCSADRAFT_204361 [Bipolaris sorokiniana ND90Pr]KAF5852306.1 hypothetical protein GGP41_007738 [Bipolaris sorokiniana]
MQYRLVSMLAAGVLVAMSSAAPVPSPDNLSITNPPNTIELGKPSSEISWGRSVDTEVTNPDVVDISPPTSEIIWSKEKKARGVEFEKPKDSFNLGNANTVVTWGKRDSTTGVTPEDTIELGKPSTEITWSKEKRDELVTPDDSISLGKPSTVVTWS